MNVDVSVVIVTYNSVADAGRCLASLREHTHGVSFEAIVVDNASTDGTAALVEREHPWAQVIARRTNGGLSRAVNEGVAASSGDYVVALNPDTWIEHDALALLATFAREHEGVGVVAPKLLDPDGTVQLSCRAFPGYSTAFFNRYSLLTKVFPSNRRSRDYLMQDFDHESTRDVDWVSGAAMLMPRTVFDHLGGWDPELFLFNEDVDFCRRVHDAGLRVVYLPQARVYHTIGISKSTSVRMIVQRHRSIWRYYRKHLHGNAARDAVTGAAIVGRCAVMVAVSLVRRVLNRS